MVRPSFLIYRMKLTPVLQGVVYKAPHMGTGIQKILPKWQIFLFLDIFSSCPQHTNKGPWIPHLSLGDTGKALQVQARQQNPGGCCPTITRSLVEKCSVRLDC